MAAYMYNRNHIWCFFEIINIYFEYLWVYYKILGVGLLYQYRSEVVAFSKCVSNYLFESFYSRSFMDYKENNINEIK